MISMVYQPKHSNSYSICEHPTGTSRSLNLASLRCMSVSTCFTAATICFAWNPKHRSHSWSSKNAWTPGVSFSSEGKHLSHLPTTALYMSIMASALSIIREIIGSCAVGWRVSQNRFWGRVQWSVAVRRPRHSNLCRRYEAWKKTWRGSFLYTSKATDDDTSVVRPGSYLYRNDTLTHRIALDSSVTGVDQFELVLD